MEESKVKELLSVDYIFIPYNTENNVHLRESKLVYKEDLIVNETKKIYSPVSGVFKGAGEINSVKGERKVVIIENDFKDTLEKRNISVNDIYDLKEDIVKQTWKPKSSEVYLKIDNKDSFDLKDEFLLKDHMNIVLKTLDIIDQSYPDIEVKIALDKSNIGVYQAIFSYLGTYPNIRVEFGLIPEESTILTLYDVIDIYNELKKCNIRDYIYLTLKKHDTFEILKTKRNANLKDLLEELNIPTNNVLINGKIKLSGTNFLLDEDVYEIETK